MLAAVTVLCAGFRAWGREMNKDVSPIEAGLMPFVRMKKKVHTANIHVDTCISTCVFTCIATCYFLGQLYRQVRCVRAAADPRRPLRGLPQVASVTQCRALLSSACAGWTPTTATPRVTRAW